MNVYNVSNRDDLKFDKKVAFVEVEKLLIGRWKVLLLSLSLLAEGGSSASNYKSRLKL